MALSIWGSYKVNIMVIEWLCSSSCNAYIIWNGKKKPLLLLKFRYFPTNNFRTKWKNINSCEPLVIEPVFGAPEFTLVC